MNEAEEVDRSAALSAEPEADSLGFRERNLDLVSLKALAHPLRVQIVDTLSTYGSFTASGLAERLGESSGATSYHLRQLEKHGFVREVEGKGTGRERWWERTPGAINIGSEEATATPAGKSAASLIWRQFRVTQTQLLTDFVERADELGPNWRDSAAISTINSRLTPTQLAVFVREVNKLVDKYVMPYKYQTAPGSRPVHIDFNAFPVVDGDVAPGEAEEEKP
jgi:DNA-binding transcriptional ArsR family regulator